MPTTFIATEESSGILSRCVASTAGKILRERNRTGFLDRKREIIAAKAQKESWMSDEETFSGGRR